MNVRVENQQVEQKIRLPPTLQEEFDEDDVVPFPTMTSNPLTPENEHRELNEYPVDNAVGRSSSLINLLNAYEKPQCADKDAGNKPHNHYKSKLPNWRYEIRNSLLPFIRWETPYLAALQRRSRNVVLDLYFALTANFGTHTFYVIILPVGYWIGHAAFGRSLVFVLAFGVYITGVIKDLLCLPRPLSPPLHRITMSGSAALEYGFPSTHSANAVSVGLLVWDALRESKANWTPFGYACCMMLNVIYVFSIVWGRIHCGMHGFCDVVVGSIIGTALWWVRFTYGAAMDAFLLNPDSYLPLMVSIPLLLGSVWIHPEPADDCPCYDDAVAFIGVVIGVCIGQWHLARITSDSAIPYDFASSGVLGTVLRLVIGISLIGIWRPVMKRALHAFLPPVYRFIERIGISMPRKFFTPASQYEDVPSSISDSTFFEPYQLTSMFSRMSKVHRSDSVGPQSTADIYESLAYREYQRQKAASQKSKKEDSAETSALRSNSGSPRIKETSTTNNNNDNDYDHDDNNDDDDITSTLVIPRVRYDVEVVTKLIVYAGIAYIATDFCGVLFPAIGI